MKKETLIKFIDKYSIGGLIKSVNWKVLSGDKALRTRGELDSKTFIADIISYNFTEIAEDIRISIGDTEKIRSMLSPFGEDIKLDLNKNGDRVLGITISDKDCESYCSSADPSAIPPVTKDVTDKNVYDIEIALTEEFTTRFLKAKTALSEIEEFTVKMNKDDKVEFVLGYSIANTNRITLIAPTINGKDKFIGQPVKFVSKNLIEILKANKEIPNGILSFSPRGVIKTVYKNDQFQCNYWQFAQMVKK